MSEIDAIRTRLVESDLMTVETADGYYAAWLAQLNEGADRSAESFVDWLIEGEMLTELHGEAILAGHTGPFVLGPYLVQEQIISSRSGGVFRAIHEEFEQPVSLKVFPRAVSSDEELEARMGREARISSLLDHPNVVRSFQVGRLGDIYFLALEDLQGETLQERLQRQRRLPYDEACRVIRSIAHGLAHMHQHEVFHRDLRPSNIWLTTGGMPKIIEFGASVDALTFLDKLEDAPGDDEEYPTRGDMIITKYDYMPPEQAYDENCADHLSDIYSLGCIFYHCLTGRPPFNDRNPVKKVLRHVYDVPQPPSEMFADIPRPLDDTIAGMLAKQYEDRFQTAEDVVWALSQYLDDESTGEQIAVVEVSPQYIEWAQAHRAESPHLTNDSVGASPQLSSFLDFVSSRHDRRSYR